MLPVIPVVLFASIIGLLALCSKSPDKVGSTLPPRRLQGVGGDFQTLPQTETRRFLPEEERLFSLLVLFARDKKYRAGQKRYLTPEMAVEALMLSKQLGLPKTVMAIRKDGAIPDDEFLRGLSGSVRQLTLSYGTGGRA